VGPREGSPCRRGTPWPHPFRCSVSAGFPLPSLHCILLSTVAWRARSSVVEQMCGHTSQCMTRLINLKACPAGCARRSCDAPRLTLVLVFVVAGRPLQNPVRGAPQLRRDGQAAATGVRGVWRRQKRLHRAQHQVRFAIRVLHAPFTLRRCACVKFAKRHQPTVPPTAAVLQTSP